MCACSYWYSLPWFRAIWIYGQVVGYAVLNAIIAIVVLFLYKDLNPYEPFNTENHITTFGALLIKTDAVILLYVKVTVVMHIRSYNRICGGERAENLYSLSLSA